MLDYKGIEALLTVQKLQSFEAAAKKLHITQSAISQRIKGLETFHGEPVLVRTLPYQATPLGQKLIAHFMQVCLLEEEFERERHSAKSPHISIAINRDSLETWFLDLIEDEAVFGNLVVKVVADDQELTLDYLKKGLVDACLSTQEKPISGGISRFLGEMEYVMAASPAFIKKHFIHKDQKKNLSEAPAIKFDQKDRLHERYLEKFFGLKSEALNFHFVPSVRGFKKFAVLGYGYGLIPTIDMREELRANKLVQLFSGNTWKIPLYWHYWSIQANFYQKLQEDIVNRVAGKLE